MIIDKEELFIRIKNYSFDNPDSSIDYDHKVILLEDSINNAVREILETNSEIHLAYSGGIDSSLILVKFLKQLSDNFLITAHTIGSENEPDILYSQEFIKELKKEHQNLNHIIHTGKISQEDVSHSNEILGVSQSFPDNYYMLMKIIAKYTKKVVCCDCIDELLGGYYGHRDPQRLEFYDSEKSIIENRFAVLEDYLSRLIPDHLEILDKFSSHFGVDVFLPYGNRKVMDSCKKFIIEEMVDNIDRKKPLYDIARRNGINQKILERRKYGLVSAFNVESKK